MNQELFDLERPTGHLIIEAYGKRMLIDTGASVSVSDEYFEFMDKFTLPATTFHGHPLSKLSEWIGTEVDVLIGMDVIQQFDWVIDGWEQKVVVSKLPIVLKPSNTSSIPFFNYFSKRFLILPVEVSQPTHSQEVNLFFDTGSRITYLHSSLLQDLPYLEDENAQWREFYPNYGHFNVSCPFVA